MPVQNGLIFTRLYSKAKGLVFFEGKHECFCYSQISVLRCYTYQFKVFFLSGFDFNHNVILINTFNKS